MAPGVRFEDWNGTVSLASLALYKLFAHAYRVLGVRFLSLLFIVSVQFFHTIR